MALALGRKGLRMTDFWFKPKKNMIGTLPSTWQGWMLVLAYAVANFALVYIFLIIPMLADAEPTMLQYITWIVLVGVASTIFFLVCRAKTDVEGKSG